MSQRLRGIFFYFKPFVFSLLLVILVYFVFRIAVSPGLILPRTLKVHQSSKQGTSTLSEKQQLDQKYDDLLEPLFSNTNDWKLKLPIKYVRNQVMVLAKIPNEDSYDKKGEISEDSALMENITLDACVVVIPDNDPSLDEAERYRRAIVIETSNDIVVNFSRPISLIELKDADLQSIVKSGTLKGELKVWSKGDPGDPSDDLDFSMREVSFNMEQFVSKKNFAFLSGGMSAEGEGITIKWNIPAKSKVSYSAKGETNTEPNPVEEAYLKGNVLHGFSIEKISVKNISMKIRISDYLPQLPNMKKLNGMQKEDPDSDTEQTATINFRSSGPASFMPSSRAPAVWNVRFPEEVEITAEHQERHQDSLHCSSLNFSLIDQDMKSLLDRHSGQIPSRRRPTGVIKKLVPYQLQAIGSEEKKAEIQIDDNFFKAASGEIFCDIIAKYLLFRPLFDKSGTLIPSGTNPEEAVKAVLEYGENRLVADHVSFEQESERSGILKAGMKGKLEAKLPNKEGETTSVNLEWNEGFQIVPYRENSQTDSQGENLFAASLRGGIKGTADQIGEMTADEGDFWFYLNNEEDKKRGGNDLPLVPYKARISGNVQMTSTLGDCHIEDTIELVPSMTAGSAGGAASFIQDKRRQGISFSQEKKRDSKLSLSGKVLKIWADMMPGNNFKVTRVDLKDHVEVLEKDLMSGGESFRLTGNGVVLTDPNSPRITASLEGTPATFTGSGLDLTCSFIKLDRAANRLSVNGGGRLRITPAQKDTHGGNLSGAGISGPVDVTWPKGVVFDGQTLKFQGIDLDEGDADPNEKNRVIVQGNSFNMKSPNIDLHLKRKVDIFDLNAGGNRQNGIDLESVRCEGSVRVPVLFEWNGNIPAEKKNGEKTSLAGRGKGDVTDLVYMVESGDFTAMGPGSFGGTVETPKEALSKESTSAEKTKTDSPLDKFVSADSLKEWTHFHLIFQEKMEGNANAHRVKVNRDVRCAIETSSNPETEIDVRNRKSLTPDSSIILTCKELSGAEILSSDGNEKNFEVAARGDTDFSFGSAAGHAETIKYDHSKRTIMLQGGDNAPAQFYLQERPGAPVKHMRFESGTFDLKTRRLAGDVSETSFDLGE